MLYFPVTRRMVGATLFASFPMQTCYNLHFIHQTKSFGAQSEEKYTERFMEHCLKRIPTQFLFVLLRLSDCKIQIPQDNALAYGQMPIKTCVQLTHVLMSLEVGTIHTLNEYFFCREGIGMTRYHLSMSLSKRTLASDVI